MSCSMRLIVELFIDIESPSVYFHAALVDSLCLAAWRSHRIVSLASFFREVLFVR